jgi:hypothetical protein
MENSKHAGLLLPIYYVQNFKKIHLFIRNNCFMKFNIIRNSCVGMICFVFLISTLITACKSNSDSAGDENAGKTPVRDTLTYAFKATYSSDVSVPGNPLIAQEVLKIWKMFESDQIEAMKPYFADTVKYDDAGGMHFYGSSADLLAYAGKDISNLDSLRFDISTWQCAHLNDKNEDWVNIWSAERRYPKNGKPDTTFIQENWKVKDGKVTYFNQYKARIRN